MRRLLPCSLVVLMALLSLLAFRSIGSSAPREAEGEHEPIVYRGATACGIERWSVKTGIDGDARFVNQRITVPTSLIKLRSLKPPGDLPARNRIRPVETTVWSVQALLVRYKEETDSDYHLVLSDTGGRTMIAEIPSPSCVGSSSPFLSCIREVRSAFAARFHPTDAFQRVHVPIQVAGVGFFDFIHGQSGVAPNGIELHPVLSIAFGGSSPASPPQTGPPPPPPPQAQPAGFSVRAWVSPSSMPYNAYPTLYGQTSSGAICVAAVLYATGSRPRSFDGSARTAGSSGMVSWRWHEESRGTGGLGTVTCRYRGATRRATATFTVMG